MKLSVGIKAYDAIPWSRFHSLSDKHHHHSHSYHVKTTRSSKLHKPLSRSVIINHAVWRPASFQVSNIFPSGRRQPQLEAPSFILRVPVDTAGTTEVLGTIRECLKGGANYILLTDLQNSQVSANEMYGLAISIKDSLRDRAGLLIEGRIDIAEAVEASGVVLTEDSVPLAVARKMLKQKPFLIGRTVRSPAEVRKEASEGASFILLQSLSVDQIEDARSLLKGGRVPIVPIVHDLSDPEVEKLLPGQEGIAVSVNSIVEASRLKGNSAGGSNVASLCKAIIQAMKSDIVQPASPERTEKQETQPQRVLLTESRKKFLEKEKVLLQSCLEVLSRISPQIEERSLLEAALKQLDELFLVVVVGEYNSGKSSVINAMLGSQFLDEGILPTTNEISVLRHTDSDPEVVTMPDGIVERTLPAPLLKEINVVDTPGTNVVLERQQRLTEEYVPRADMVLFVLSCDRPFTESEVRFLEYIRKWGKKVIFVVNKIDMLSGDDDVESVKAFVSQNARQLLNLNEAFVWPVSARMALAAKLDLGNSNFGGLFQNGDSSRLDLDERWRRSRFSEIESFIAEFFSGEGGAASAESVRLKLQTPIYVADALLDASKRQLKNERFAAEKDVAAAKAVAVQLAQFASDMHRDLKVQLQSIRKLMDKVASRAEGFVDETLLVSNFFTLRGYLTETTGVGGKEQSRVSQGFSASVIGSAINELKDLIDQQAGWIQKNCQNQISNYRSFADNCAQQFGKALSEIVSLKEDVPPDSSVDDLPAEEMADWEIVSGALENKISVDLILDRVIKNEAVGAELCERLIESEIRDAVNATGGTALAAIGIGFALTLVLPSTLEDILALAVSFLLGYVAVLNLPLRRNEIKSRIRKLTKNLEESLEKKLDHRLAVALEDSSSKISHMITPLEKMFEGISLSEGRPDRAPPAELARVIRHEEERSQIESQIQNLKTQILNIE